MRGNTDAAFLVGALCGVVICVMTQTIINIADEYRIVKKEPINHEEPIRSRALRTFEITAYCPGACCCGEFADGKTATGTNAHTPGVAVDSRVIPYGTRLIIPGYNQGNVVVADDCGSAIKGNRLDIRFNDHQSALNWGRKTIEVEILK